MHLKRLVLPRVTGKLVSSHYLQETLNHIQCQAGSLCKSFWKCRWLHSLQEFRGYTFQSSFRETVWAVPWGYQGNHPPQSKFNQILRALTLMGPFISLSFPFEGSNKSAGVCCVYTRGSSQGIEKPHMAFPPHMELLLWTCEFCLAGDMQGSELKQVF